MTVCEACNGSRQERILGRDNSEEVIPCSMCALPSAKLAPEDAGLVERLRQYAAAFGISIGPHVESDLDEAADTITRLSAELADARGALEAFATFADTFIDAEGWSGPMKQERIVDWFGPSDFRRARSCLPPPPEDDKR